VWKFLLFHQDCSSVVQNNHCCPGGILWSVPLESVFQWLDFSIDDLDSAGIMLKEGKFNNVCYFSHQAVEKSLKGYLLHNNIAPPRIHDLIELLNQCKIINSDFLRFISQVRKIGRAHV